MPYSNSYIDNNSLFKDWNNGDVIQAARLNAIHNAIKIIDKYLKDTEGANGSIANQTYVNTSINNAINNLSVTPITGSTTQTITSISEIGGKVSATFSNITVASASDKGIMQVGTNLSVNAGTVSLSSSITGNITVDNLSVTAFGTIPTYSQNNKNYGVQQSGGALYVNVPWTNTTYTAGTGLSLTNTQFNLNTASAENLGGIKVGDNLAINNGVLSGNYPTATSTTLGLIKVGNNLSIDNGVLSGSYVNATTNAPGIVQIGDNLNITEGILSAPIASTTTYGMIKIGDHLSIDEDGALNGIGISAAEQGGQTPSIITTGERYAWADAADKINNFLPDVSSLNAGTYTYNLQVTINNQQEVSYEWVPIT